MDIETNSKGKPVKVTDEDGVEYVCIPQSQLDRVTADFNATATMKDRISFANGYRFAMERIGTQYFGELKQVPEKEIVLAPTETIKIGTGEYFLHEVVERLNGLPTKSSIWRK